MKTCLKIKWSSLQYKIVNRIFLNFSCHTPVGYHGRRSDVTLGTGCLRKGTVMHEVLHALGFWHEQSRADRDNYVKIHFENIQSSKRNRMTVICAFFAIVSHKRILPNIKLLFYLKVTLETSINTK